MTFHYQESADSPIRIIPMDQPNVRQKTKAEKAGCERYRATLDESALSLAGPPLVYVFRELTWDRFERAVRDAGGSHDPRAPILDVPRARQIFRQCLAGWENPHTSWPKFDELTEYDGGESLIGKGFVARVPPSHVSECGLTLWRTMILGKPNEAKNKGEIQAEANPGN